MSKTRNEIIQELKLYFDVRELVCPHTFKRFGQKSWMFLDAQLLHVLLVLRTDILNVPLVLNDYLFGGKNTQRGLRCNICPLVKSKTDNYLSAHILGKGVDIVSSKMTAYEMRERIRDKWHRLPCKVRIEGDVSWLHIDTYDDGNNQMVTTFNV